jgi:hypothetical protein
MDHHQLLPQMGHALVLALGHGNVYQAPVTSLPSDGVEHYFEILQPASNSFQLILTHLFFWPFEPVAAFLRSDLSRIAF